MRLGRKAILSSLEMTEKKEEKRSELSDFVFVDRAQELSLFRQALNKPEIQAIIVTGYGGTGKTMLAQYIARQERESGRFPGGVIFVDCAYNTSLASILSTIASAVGIDSETLTSGALRKTVQGHLRANPTLLILDSYEVVAEDDQILSFVGRLPRKTKTLILTREKVRISGQEIMIALTPFADDAVLELFRARLGSERLAKFDKDALSDVTRLTGGLPLAVSLVADLLAKRPLTDVLSGLEEEPIVTKMVTDLVLERIDSTLETNQKNFLNALSVFTHSAKGEAVAAVAELENWRPLSEDLKQQAFIRVVDGRLELHAVVRSYFRSAIAPKHLADLQRRMVKYFLAYVEEFHDDFEQIDREWLNIQYAIDVAFSNNLSHEFVKIIIDIGSFLDTHKNRFKYREWLRNAIEASQAINDEASRAALLHNLAVQYQREGELSIATDLYQQSLQILQKSGNLTAGSATLLNLGSIYRSLGDNGRAIDLYNRSLAINKEIGDRGGEATTLNNMAGVYQATGRPAEALALYEEALPIMREVGDRGGEATTLNNMAGVYQATGRPAEALALYEEALPISREVGDRVGEATTLNNMAGVYSAVGQPQQALALYEEALPISREVGDRVGEATTLNNMALVYQIAGKKKQSLEHMEQAIAVSRQIGDRQTEANFYINLGSTYRDQYARTGERDNLHNAITVYRQALKAFVEAEYPGAATNFLNSLGNTYRDLYSVTGDREYAAQAVAYYQRALESSSRESSPVDWARVQGNLGRALSERIVGDRKNNLTLAIASYEAALSVFTKESFTGDWLSVKSNLSVAYAELGNWPEAKKHAGDILETFRGTMSSFEILMPWYEQLGELSIRNGDLEFATRVFAQAADRLELQNKQVPTAISARLIELREKLGDDHFVIILAEEQGVLTPVLAQTFQEARRLMSSEEFGAAAERFSDALDLLSESEESKDLARKKATILFLQGFCFRKMELWDVALQAQEKAFRLFETVRDFVGEAYTLLEMGHLFEVMNNYEDARLHYMDAYRLYHRAGETRGKALASENLGRLEYRVRMFSQAVEDLEEARRLYMSLGDTIKAATIDSDLSSAKASLAYHATTKD